jgi:hypothetical protein
MPLWKREVKIEGDRVVELKRLTNFGNGFALVVPTVWVRTYCGADHKVEIAVEDGTITIKGYRGGG